MIGSPAFSLPLRFVYQSKLHQLTRCISYWDSWNFVETASIPKWTKLESVSWTSMMSTLPSTDDRIKLNRFYVSGSNGKKVSQTMA